MGQLNVIEGFHKVPAVSGGQQYKEVICLFITNKSEMVLLEGRVFTVVKHKNIIRKYILRLFNNY